MKFVDKTGHIFNLPSYDITPIGFEYEENSYVFWLDNEYTDKLSIDNYYMMTIRLFSNEKKISNIEITLHDSNVFRLISSSLIQEQIKLTGKVELSDSMLKRSLNISDVAILEDNNEQLIPFYIIGKSNEEGSVISNILIHMTYEDGTEDWCPITVGGSFYDMNEVLVINGQNYGISLPKDAMKGIYQQSLINDEVDLTLYNEKLKEWLINYMVLKNECGNINQAVKSLNWFGWGDKLSIYKLVKTDNDAMTQFMRDAIDSVSDNIEAYKYFKDTASLAIECRENQESGEEYKFSFEEEFWGEGKPILESLFDKLIEVNHGDITYYRSYYDYAFEELSLKLANLAYFYKKLFLPMHAAVHSYSLNHSVFCNDIKFVTVPFNKIVEKTKLLAQHESSNLKVVFQDTNIIQLNTNAHYIDSNYNEFYNYEKIGKETDESIYYINNINFTIPLKFESSNERFYDVVFILRKHGKQVFESHFSFTEENDIIGDFKQVVIIPQLLNRKFDINYWVDKEYDVNVLVNGKWFEWSFVLKMPELQIMFGKLEYEYDHQMFRQVNSISDNSIDFNAQMHTPSLIDVNNIRFPIEVIDYTNKNNILKFIEKYRDLPNVSDDSKYHCIVHFYNIKDYFTNEEIEYDGTDNIDLYRYFFNDDGGLKDYINKAISNESRNIKYDAFIMHDDNNIESYEGILSKKELESFKPHWYLVLISRETVDKKKENSDLFAPSFNSKTYRIEHVGTDYKFLINRMKYVPTNGINRFKCDDIVAGTINNIDVPFVMSLGTKWHIEPFSLKMNNSAEVDANANTFLMSIGDQNHIYERGYYDVTVRYSIDGFTQQQLKSDTKILIL